MDGLVLFVIGYGVVICALLTIMLCGESSSIPLMRRAHAFLTRGLWGYVRGALRMVCGSAPDKAARYLCTTNHPLLSIFYLVLVWGGVAVFCTATLPYIPNPLIPWYHLIGIPIAILLPNFVFYKASHTPPGVVTAETAADFAAVYPYDGVVFSPKTCRTCEGVVRPARTKHCSLCGVCVARFDHHCAWINNCVGEHNLKWFLAFLLSTSALCAYGAFLCAVVLVYIVEEEDLFNKFVRGANGEAIPVGWELVFKYVMVFHSGVMGVGVFMAVISFVLYCFFLYHCYLIAKNTTTAETFKYADARADLRYWKWRRDELLNDKARLDAARAALKARDGPQPLPSDPDADLSDADLLAMTDLPDRIDNVYNKGVIANFREALLPPTQRPTLPQPTARALEAQAAMYEATGQRGGKVDKAGKTGKVAGKRGGKGGGKRGGKGKKSKQS